MSAMHKCPRCRDLLPLDDPGPVGIGEHGHLVHGDGTACIRDRDVLHIAVRRDVDVVSDFEGAAHMLPSQLVADIRARQRAVASKKRDANGIKWGGGQLSDALGYKLAVQGWPGCRSVTCTRRNGKCIGWHCPRCGKPTDAQGGHDCPDRP